MPSIFISYAREDRPQAEKLASALQAQGWSVWWDVVIPAGRTFDDVIDEAMDAAKCVIVMWSRSSVDSRYVRGEAQDAAEREILVPVLIEKDIRIPRGFRSIHAADLTDWDGTSTASSFLRLTEDIARLLGPRPIIVTEAQRTEAVPVLRTATQKSDRARARWAALPNLTKGLDAGVSLFSALAMSHLLVPDQLSFMRAGALVGSVLGILASWIGRLHVRRHAGKIVFAAVLFLVSLLLMDAVVVTEVRFGKETSHLLIGTTLTGYGDVVANQIGTSSPSEIIRAAGKDQIPALWADYYPLAVVYVLCLTLLSFLAAMAIGVLLDRLTTRKREPSNYEAELI